MILEKCLSKVAENSKYIFQVSSGDSHTTLNCASENNGVHRLGQSEVIDLISALSTVLTRGITEDFRKVFPNDGKSGPFYGVLHDFSLGTIILMQKYEGLKLQLIFIKSQEEKIKTKLIKVIRNRKKMIYNSLTLTVEEILQESYTKAATAKISLQRLMDTVFDHAKSNMLSQLQNLMNLVLDTLSESLHNSIQLSLREDTSVPDISIEFEEVTKLYNELTSTEGEDDLLLSDSDMDIL
ncbi:hypothetical protein WMY93_003696 [Mugilogobius chulae]|uniref:Uncharacterized protein n=1 Tax=Mugilogobius chulae TaxID=88201 RepID=A0AAW0Q5P1_9GOBI